MGLYVGILACAGEFLGVLQGWLQSRTFYLTVTLKTLLTTLKRMSALGTKNLSFNPCTKLGPPYSGHTLPQFPGYRVVARTALTFSKAAKST